MFCEELSGISPVPIRYVVITPNKSDSDSYGRRIVKHYELEYITAGTGYCVTDGVSLPQTAHALNFRRPGMVTEGMGIYHGHYIEFDFNEHGDAPDLLNSMPNSFFLENFQEASDIFAAIFNDYFADSLTRLLSYKIQVLGLFELMIRDWYARTSLPGVHATAAADSIKQSVRYLQEHYAEPVTVTALAEQAGYSLFHYTRTFKRVMNESPIQFLNRIRIGRARQLLAETSLTASQVLEQCGFENYSYFYRVFHHSCGMTPKEYRVRHQKM